MTFYSDFNPNPRKPGQVRDLCKVLKGKVVGEFTAEQILQKIERIGFKDAYSKLLAKPTPAKIVEFDRIELWNLGGGFNAISTRMFYRPMCRMRTTLGEFLILEDEIFMPDPETEFSRPLSKEDKEHLSEHEEYHHIQKSFIQSFFSSSDDDTVKNAVKLTLNELISEQELKEHARDQKEVFPKAKYLGELNKTSTENIRLCADLLSSLLLLFCTERWASEGFAEYSVFYPNSPKKTYETSYSYSAAKEWEELVSGLNKKERFLLSAFPPKNRERAGERLKLLEEYFSL